MELLQGFYSHFVIGRPAIGLLLVRLVFGAAFVLHGLGKIQNPMAWMGPGAPVPGFLQALAALSEFGGGIAMILGFLTPLAALGLLFTMSFATFAVHMASGDPFVSATGGRSYELALVYWAISLNILLTGPGVYSLDALLFSKKSRNQ
jgi:putative oxidoreductase